MFAHAHFAKSYFTEHYWPPGFGIGIPFRKPTGGKPAKGGKGRKGKRKQQLPAIMPQIPMLSAMRSGIKLSQLLHKAEARLALQLQQRLAQDDEETIMLISAALLALEDSE